MFVLALTPLAIVFVMTVRRLYRIPLGLQSRAGGGPGASRLPQA